MNLATEYLPFLLPAIIVELGLMIAALVHVLKHTDYRFGNKPIWIAVVVLIQIIGPIIYFVFGRSDQG